jgi:hypothetical protein
MYASPISIAHAYVPQCLTWQAINPAHGSMIQEPWSQNLVRQALEVHRALQHPEPRPFESYSVQPSFIGEVQTLGNDGCDPWRFM